MSQGVTFYFVRHGETYLNKYQRMQGWCNAPLTPEGIEDVHRSGRGLADVEFDAVYTSDLMRTIETAQILLEENHHADALEIQPLYEFREVGFGSHDGLSAADIWPKAESSARYHHNIPEGTEVEIQYFIDMLASLDPYRDAENYVEFWERVEKGLLILLNRHAGTGDHVLVVCHGLTIRNLLHGLVADFSETEALDNASVSIVDYRDGQFRLKEYNKTDHFID